MGKLHKLSQELINQIAAGEVIERPSSVIKELVDNSIDAKSTEIKIRLVEGGLALLEVYDNGVGIDKESLSEVFEAHTTSKLNSLDDLSTLNTMGFRGEALSTIKSVSNVKIVSRQIDNEFAYLVDFSKSNIPSKEARNVGTTITVSNIFSKIPARLKFLKSSETEYRKILDLIYQFAISQPNIHFQLTKDGKEVLNLPPKDLQTRIKDILKKDFIDRMITLKSEGAGIKISGFIAHPKDAGERVSHQYIFINNRPIWDNGIAKSIYLGYSRFIPHSFKVPFIIFIEIEGSMVDVNVHPRKEEVKFINPYRVYSSIENAVASALSASTTNQYQQQLEQPSSAFLDSASIKYDSENNLKEIKFDKKPTDFNISSSLNFSKKLLEHQTPLPFEVETKPQSTVDIFGEFKNIFQIFNKYIVIEFEQQIWMIDQHAGAERITYEKLLNSDKLEIQNILVPIEIQINEIENSFYTQNINFFKSMGFNMNIEEDKLIFTSIPSHISINDIDKIFSSISTLLENESDMKNILEKKREDILATIACHGSVRAGQRLSREECINIYVQLGKCINPFSCPHGRPAVWKLKLTEIDSNFYRTY
jgi:DNA mismatch repair protein MutL